MKRVSLAAMAGMLLLTLILAATSVARGRTETLPPGHYRLTMNEIIRQNDLVVVQVDIETHGVKVVRIRSERPRGGGLGAAPETVVAQGANAESAIERTRLTIVCDRLTWGAGKNDGVKFMLDLKAGGQATQSSTGTTPEGKSLKDLLKITAQSGVYLNETQTKLVAFGDDSYTVTVETADN